MIEVMNRFKYVFSHRPLVRITEIQDNILPITVERVRPTTDISRQERKRQCGWLTEPHYVMTEVS
jgi:hypothetical protein